jgi:hypothetical protein
VHTPSIYVESTFTPDDLISWSERSRFKRLYLFTKVLRWNKRFSSENVRELCLRLIEQSGCYLLVATAEIIYWHPSSPKKL